MKKVNEFETSVSNHTEAHEGILFTDEQKKQYTYPSVEELLENPEDLLEMVKHFIECQVPRLRILESYDVGDNEGVLRRQARKDEGRLDYRARHNFGGYISTFHNGYMFGIPVKVEHENEAIKQVIDEVGATNDIDSLNSELGYDCSRFGRAYEIHYRNQNDEDKIALSSVYETFLIYDSSVESLPIAAVRCPIHSWKGKREIEITLYTADKIIEYEPMTLEANMLKVKHEYPNLRGRLPIVEWWNNRYRLGDYERVLSLIDLYDFAQSDTANYMHDLNDAMLVISGDLDKDSYSVEDLIRMKKANLLLLEGGEDMTGRPTNVSASYLYKQYDVGGKEAYNKRVQEDIHKFTHVPDLSDNSFGGNQSGVAMKYKLFGLRQLRATKEKYYSKALRERYRVISGLHTQLHAQDLDAENLTIIFTENLPEDEWGEIKDFYSVGGRLSQKTKLERLTFVQDAKEEMKAIEEEDLGYSECGFSILKDSDE